MFDAAASSACTRPPDPITMGEVGREGAVGSISTPIDVVELYQRESRRLHGMLFAFTGSVADAEDITQEAFLHVQRAWGRIRDPDAAAAYLRTTAFNLARSGMRRRARALRLPAHVWALPGEDRETHFDDAVADALTLRDDQRAVMAALRSLPARQRACVVLRFYDGQGPEAIGRILGISTNSVKTHLQRALGSLRIQLEGRR